MKTFIEFPRAFYFDSTLSTVMPGLVPGIHVFLFNFLTKAWMAGTSPAMTRTDTVSLDHRVGALLKEHRHVEAERLGGLEVDRQLELDRGLDWQLARFRALEDAIDISRGAPVVVEKVDSV